MRILGLTRPSGKLGRFSLKFEIPRLSRQERSSCLASLRISLQIENLFLGSVERGDTQIVGVNPPDNDDDLTDKAQLYILWPWEAFK